MLVIRILLSLLGLFFLLVGISLLFFFPTFPTSWIDGYLLGATFTAYAIATLWIASTQTYKALLGAGIAATLTFGGSGLYLLQLSKKMPALQMEGEAILYLSVLSLWLFFLGLKVSHRKPDSLPVSLQSLFGLVFTFALLEGLHLVLPSPAHFPWLLTPEFSVLYGWVLIGGSLFFGWALVQATWENAYPLLYGLVFYNALMIGPYFGMLKEGSEISVNPFYLWLAIGATLITGGWSIFELIRRFFFRPRYLS